MDLSLNPYPWYAEMRRSSPVVFDEGSKWWLVFDYPTVKQVFTDYQTFSSSMEDDNTMFGSSMILNDPPRHRQLRSLATVAFTPRAIETLTPRISEIVAELLDAMAGKPQVEFMDEFATPLPTTVIAELIGIPTADQAQYKEWSQGIMAMTTQGLNETTMQPMMQMGAYFYQMIQERRENPRDDFITGLINASVDGEQLSDMDIIGFCSLLLLAGNETTTNFLGNAMRVFYERPDVYQAIRNDPSLIPAAIEEVFRYYAPVRGMLRRNVNDVELHGKHIPANSTILALLSSANRDEQQFPNPDEFDIHRNPNQHIAFGHGIHYCLGAPLARLEARIALKAITERYSTVELVPNFEPQAQPSRVTMGAVSLPLILTPA